MKVTLFALLSLVAFPVFAAAVVQTSGLGQALLWLVGWGLILYVLWWALNKINPPEPLKTIGVVLLVIVSVVVAIDFISTIFFGSPLVRF